MKRLEGRADTLYIMPSSIPRLSLICSFQKSDYNVSPDSLREDCPNSDIIVIFARDLCEPLLALEGLGASHTYV